MKKIIFLITFFILTSASAAQKDKEDSDAIVTAQATVDKNPINIGDKIKYLITVKTKKNIEVEFPNFPDNLVGGLAVKDFGSYHKSFLGKKTFIQWYLLDTYTTGKYTIPKVTVKYRQLAKMRRGQAESVPANWQDLDTNSLEIEVKSVINDDPKKINDIKDISGPVYLPNKLFLAIIILASLLLLLGIIGGLCFLTYKHKQSKKEIYIPAHKLAYAALAKLKEKDYVNQGLIKEYYSALSDIVRHYLENRFKIKAPEMTTEEFLITIKNSSVLTYEHKGLLRDFLSHCDMVKFAKYLPIAEEIDKSMDLAVRLIEQTKEEENVVAIHELPLH